MGADNKLVLMMKEMKKSEPNDKAITFFDFLLSSVSNEDIISAKLDNETKGYLLYKKNGETIFDTVDLKRGVYLDFARIEENNLVIEGYYKKVLYSLNPKLRIECNDVEVSYREIVRIDSDVFLGEVISQNVGFRIAIPVEKLQDDFNIAFYFVKNQKKNEIDKITFCKYFPISTKYTKSYCTVGKHKMTRDGNRLRFTTKYNRFYSEVAFLRELKTKKERGSNKAIIVRTVVHIMKIFKKKRIWLFTDKPDRADDNAEVLLKYIYDNGLYNRKREKYYFMVNSDTPDYDRLKSTFDVIPFGEIKHKILSLLADGIVSGYVLEENRNPFLGHYDPYRDMLAQSKVFFLDHGVKKDDNSATLNKYKKNFAMMICSGRTEYEEYCQEKYGYFNGEVVATGLCRYDWLKNEKKDYNAIAIMPTFRTYLTNGTDAKTRMHKLVDNFEKTDYFRFYIGLMTSERLLNYLKDHNYIINFVPHPTMFSHKDLFVVPGYEDVVKVWGTEVVHREIYAESNMLITDYSSIAFDFSNLFKPIIYAQFDQETFAEKHKSIGEAYFKYDRDGFGEVEVTLEATIDRIIDYIENGCQLKDVYRERIEKFFYYHDKNNCKRNYEEIMRRI